MIHLFSLDKSYCTWNNFVPEIILMYLNWNSACVVSSYERRFLVLVSSKFIFAPVEYEVFLIP